MKRKRNEITKPETAADLIERIEQETGGRIDDPANEGAQFMLLGAMSRMAGKSPERYRLDDDYAAGVLIKFQGSPAGRAKRQVDEALARALMGGLDPGTLHALRRKK